MILELRPPENCVVIEDGTQWVVDPRSWLLWMYAMWNGLWYRATPRGMEVWEVRPIDAHPDTAYFYTVVKHSKVDQ